MTELEQPSRALPAAVGIIANPAAGKDIRRLVSAASPVSDMAKIGIIRRAAIGAMEGGAERLVLADDRHALARRAVERAGMEVEVLDLPLFSSGRDSQRAAAAMAEREVGAIVVLGGDGTHRDVAKGWRSAPIVALSTGTNNVFPQAWEATLAGQAAGAVAKGSVALSEVTAAAKVIEVDIRRADASHHHDLALVDLALSTGSFTGSRAVWDTASLLQLVTAIAEPASVGLSSIAANLAPVGRTDPGGVAIRFVTEGECPRHRIRCPIAPGLYHDVYIAAVHRLGPADVVAMGGPGVLSFDGEREVVLAQGEEATVRVLADGPQVIDVEQVLRLLQAERAAGTMPALAAMARQAMVRIDDVGSDHDADERGEVDG